MRGNPSIGWILAALVVGAGAVVDVATGLQWMPGRGRLLLLLAGLALVAWGARHRVRIVPITSATLLIAALGVGAWSEFRRTQASDHWDERARLRLESRADRLEGDFGAFLGKLESAWKMLAQRRYSEAYATDLRPASALFDLMERIRADSGLQDPRFGLTLFDSLGKPAAWTGRTSILPSDILNHIYTDESVFLVRDTPAMTRLIHLAQIGESGNSLATEFLVRSRVEAAPPDIVLPSLPQAESLWDIRYMDRKRSTVEIEEFFADRDDRHWSVATGPPTVTFPLRGPDGAILADATLRAVPATLGLPPMRERDAGIAAGLVVLALALAGIAGVRTWVRRVGSSSSGFRDSASRFVALSLCLWMVRWILSRGGFPQQVWRMPAFDFEVFGSGALGGLIVSPADLFLTAAAVLAQAILLCMLLRGIAGAWSRHASRIATPDGGLTAAVFLTIVAVLALGVIHGFRSLARHVINSSTINILDIRLTSLTLEQLLLQSGLLLVLLAGLLLVASVLFLAGSWLGLIPLSRFNPVGLPRELPLRLALLPTIAGATLVFYPVALQAHDAAARAFYERNLMPRVLESGRAFLLENAAQALQADSELLEALSSRLPRSFDELAFDAWFRTQLADDAYDSSLEILDSAGRRLGSFALNLPSADEERPGPSEEIESEIYKFVGTGGRPVLHLVRSLRVNGRRVGYVRLHVAEDHDNLPFLPSADPYSQIFGASRRPAPEEIVGGSTVLFVYDEEGNATPLGTTAPVLPNGMWPAPPGEWTRVTSPSGVPLDLLVTAGSERDGSSGRLLYALGHPAPELLLRAGQFVRLLLLHLAEATAVLLLGIVIGGIRDPSRMQLSAFMESLGRSYYRKLFASFLGASLIPLLALAIFLQGFVTREIRKEIVAEGSVALEAAAHLLSVLSSSPDGSHRAIEDRELLILRGIVGRDLHMYVEDRLIATSRRELVSAGVLSAQIDGRIYRDVYLDGQAISSAQETVSDIEYTLLAVPVALGNLTAVLALPAHSRPADVEAQVAKVGDAILIATMIMFLLVAVTGYLVARLISAPILRLVTATLRVGRGELDTRVDIRSRDETASLAASFNEMSRALKQRDDELRNNLVYIEMILDNATTGVISLDENDRIVTVNSAAEELLSVGGELRSGQDIEGFLSASPALEELGRARARAQRSQSGVHRAEVDLRDPAGEMETRRLRAVFVPFPLEDGRTGQILLLEDVTDVVRSNRLAAWAEMAQRIAHEIKNPLTPIQLSVGHLRKVYQKTRTASNKDAGDADADKRFAATLDECLTIILEQVQQLRNISGEFSDYARIPATRRKLIALEDLIGEVLRPYAGALPESVKLERRIAPDLPAVLLDPELMKRTLVNLVENALQAMPDGGRLSVSARRHDRNGDACLEIAVADTGVGIDERSLERLFEPYFSTKATGTGLGLAIARRAVEEHGGDIRAESRPGEGTTFRILLPIGPGGALPRDTILRS